MPQTDNPHPIAKRAKNLAKWAALFCVILVIGTYFAVDYSSSAEFCVSCHYMKPYYDSWKHSSHRDVTCTKCHYKPGLKSSLETKFEGLAQLTTYITGTQGSMPAAQVDDASCLRDGCHEKRLLEGKVAFGGVLFDHKAHLTTLRRGKKLRCTSCHSQIVQGQHMTVTPNTCYLCHFQGYEQEELADGCTTCHITSEAEANQYGLELFHKDSPQYGAECMSCHRDAIQGTGAISDSRCTSCHNSADHLARRNDVEFLHEWHITKKKIDCLQCHTEIIHRCETDDNKHDTDVGYPLDCASCHSDQHNTHRAVYNGIGGEGVDPMPSRMAQKRIGCNACHRTPNPKNDGYPLVTEPDCMRCHGTGISDTLAGWKSLYNGTLDQTRDALATTTREIAAAREAGRSVAAATALLDRARTNVTLLEDGKGLHNIDFALALLERSVDFANQARASVQISDRFGSPQPEKYITSDCYNTCHRGVENKEVRVFDVTMPHKNHVLTAQMDCQECHAGGDYPSKEHGSLRLSLSDCQSCHHSAQKACESCHTAQSQLYAGTGGIGVEESPSMMFEEVSCAQCHVTVSNAPSQQAIRKACKTCHEEPLYTAELDLWLTRSDAAMKEATQLLAAARELLKFTVPGDPNGERATQAVREAQHNIDLVRSGRNVHNVGYADDLLDAAIKKLRFAHGKLKPRQTRSRGE